MLPDQISCQRTALVNRTNIFQLSPSLQSRLPATRPGQKLKSGKRVSVATDGGEKKRVKLSRNEDGLATSNASDDSDEELEEIAITRATSRKSVFQLNASLLMQPVGKFRRGNISTRAILQSFVSSHKADVFKCQSNDVNAYLTPPYACSYTHGAKNNTTPLLAVATEQGSVHILNTSRRQEWDPELPRSTIQAHNNGVFDVKWNMGDNLLATCSGDQSTRITCPATEVIVHKLRGHTSTVKCIAWDPHHQDLLTTGGRDGTICLWDLRVGERNEDTEATIGPVLTISGAHESFGSKDRIKSRRSKIAPVPKSVTNLLYPDTEPYGLVSSGSFDGILRFWDLRLLRDSKKLTTAKQKSPAVLYTSPIDPTTLHGSRRPRGIISLTSGVGPSAGILFALGADSRVHTYTLPTLTAQRNGYSHSNMQTNSFYVGLAVSPCGRWLASGGTGSKGNIFLYDVTDAAHPTSALQAGVEMRGLSGEVGAVDWADGSLAACSDDGTVRVWRPDVETYRRCLDQPEEKKWEWCWSEPDA